MQVYDLPAPGRLVLPVHVLGEQHSPETTGLQHPTFSDAIAAFYPESKDPATLSVLKSI